jgi:type II secretory pathway pseudopilin PulG
MIELLMVTAIIGVLVLLAIPGYMRVQDSARTARAEAEIRDLEKAINAYAIDHGDFPGTLAAIGRLGVKDPWGHEYIYAKLVDGPPATPRLRDLTGVEGLNHDFDLYSMGSDGVSITDLDSDDITDDRCKDDIVRGGDGGFVGEARKYQPAL